MASSQWIWYTGHQNVENPNPNIGHQNVYGPEWGYVENSNPNIGHQNIYGPEWGYVEKTATWWKWTWIGLFALALSLLAAAILFCIVALALGLGLGLNSTGKLKSGLDENQARFDNLGVFTQVGRSSSTLTDTTATDASVSISFVLYNVILQHFYLCYVENVFITKFRSWPFLNNSVQLRLQTLIPGKLLFA